MQFVGLLTKLCRLLRSCGLQPGRLLCPWDSLSENTGVSCHFLLQRIFLTQELNLNLFHCKQILNQLSYEESRKHSLWHSVIFVVLNNELNCSTDYVFCCHIPPHNFFLITKVLEDIKSCSSLYLANQLMGMSLGEDIILMNTSCILKFQRGTSFMH